MVSRHGAFNLLPSYNDTTIYEVDLACYESLTPEEKRKYFPQTWEEESRMHQRNSSNLMNRVGGR